MAANLGDHIQPWASINLIDPFDESGAEDQDAADTLMPTEWLVRE